MKRSILTACVLVLFFAIPGYSPAAENGLHALQVAQELGFTKGHVEQMKSGEVIALGLAENTEKELAVAIGMHTTTPMSTMREAVKRGDLFEADQNIYDFGEIPNDSDAADALAAIEFGPGESKEVMELLRAKPGATFNLSESELQRFAALGHQRNAKSAAQDPEVRAQVSSVYRSVLLDRLNAYREGGLSRIAPYYRGKGSVVQPADELRAAGEAETGLHKYLPETYSAFMNYPADQTDDTDHQFYWFKVEANGRPAFVLAHRMRLSDGEHTIYVARQFYVGHTYNALQIVGCLIEVNDGVMVLYVNRTSTDQVTGFGSALAHKIGRGMLGESVKESFVNLRDAVRSASSA